MSSNSNFPHQRLQTLYEREISFILKKFRKENEFPSFSITYSILSAKAENLKIYLLFAKQEEQKKISLLNKQFSFWLKSQLAKTKKFSRLPKITFALDEEWEQFTKLKKIIQEID